VLLTCVGAASGRQERPASDKRAAIKKLLETGGAARQSQLIFEKLLDRFEKPFAASLIADLRAKGQFRRLNAGEVPELERRLRVFVHDVLDECKSTMAREVATPENLELIAVPAYDKYMTLDDINQLIAFGQSPLGRKVNALLPEAMAEGIIASLEAKGGFNASPEGMAKMLQSQRELQADPTQSMKDALTTLALAKRLTPDEVKALDAFRETPFGLRLVEVYPKVQDAMHANFSALYGQRAAGTLNEILRRKLKEYAEWLGEAAEPGAPRGVPPPSSSRLPPPPAVIAPSKRP
jgi:hypothetical protein